MSTPELAPPVDLAKLPDLSLLRVKTLLRGEKSMGLLPISNTAFWRLVKEGKFPQPIKLSRNVTAWRASDVREWLEKLGTTTERKAKR